MLFVLKLFELIPFNFVTGSVFLRYCTRVFIQRLHPCNRKTRSVLESAS